MLHNNNNNNNNSNTETTLKHHNRTPLQQLQLVSTNYSEAGISANITNNNRGSEAL